MSKINQILLSSGSIAAVEAVNQVPIEEVLKIVVQLVIGIATLVKLFRKPKV